MQCFLLPGKALGPFRLGSTLRECISELQFNSRDFKRVNTTFNIDDETQNDIILDIKTCGIFLRFDSIQQRLKLIDVYDLTKISIYYHKQLLTAPPLISSTRSPPITQPPSDNADIKCNTDEPLMKKDEKNSNTFARIYNIMGLTHPGFYDTKRGLYYVEYDGLWLSFLLNYDPGPSSLPVDLNDGTSPILNRLIVFYGKNGFLSHQLPPLGQTLSMIQSNKIKPTSIPLYSYYFEPIYVTLNEGIRLGWRNRNILFGCSVQDVLSDVGPPYKIHYKHKSHSVDTRRQKDNIESGFSRDYFFNYIDLGLDILFDGYTHTIKKFILHTNCVGHPDFNRWCKCNFHIILFNDMNCVITSNSKWKDILKYMGCNTGPPIMYRSSHGKIQNVNKEKVTDEQESKKNNNNNSNSNHQSIKIYGYQSVLFEIMGNQSISTVTLFHEKNYNLSVRSPAAAGIGANAGKMVRVHSLILDEQQPIPIQSTYKLPDPSTSNVHHHHSRINPSPLSKSIEEAARSQLQFVKNDKYSKKAGKKRKDKRKRKSKKQHSPQPGAVEIDHMVNDRMNVNTSRNDDKDGDLHQNEMFDNIKL